MRRLGLAAALLMGTAGVAMADPCDFGPTGMTFSPDDTNISILFDSFFSSRSSRGTCNVIMPAITGRLPILILKAMSSTAGPVRLTPRPTRAMSSQVKRRRSDAEKRTERQHPA